MTAIRRTAGLRLVRSHGQVVTASRMPLRKTALTAPTVAKALALAPALAHLARLRAELSTRAVELARDQIEANTAALEQLCAAPDWETIVAILNEYSAAAATRFAQAVQLQIQLVGQVAERLAVPG